MPKMLRHVKTGEIWPMNPNLARHPDVEIFDQPDPQFAQAAASGDATVGDLAQANVKSATANPEMMEPVFEDVPDYVPPEDEDDADQVAAAAAAADEAQKKAAAAAKRKATNAKKKAAKEAEAKAAAEAAAAAEEESEADEDDEFDLLDDLELDD